MKQYLSTKVFNPRLFLEGLKRLKVFNWATGILSVSLSVLIPVISWMITLENHRRYSSIIWNGKPAEVDYYLVILPIYLVVFIAPFMMLSLFSYLHKRKEADFFHAIPYTRTCVYVSFTLSALASVFGIMLISALAAGIAWSLNPFTYFLFADMAVQVLVCMLASAMLCGIMAVCVMLTGTRSLSVCLFSLGCVMWRYIMYLFQNCIDSTILVPSSLKYLNFDWFLPFRLFTATFDSYQSYAYRYPLSQIIYSLVLTLALFVLAGVLYKKRHSEMAGLSAPNRVMQHVFRCLFTLPVAILFPYAILEGGQEDVTWVILGVLTLLVYYLYELLTTKSFKGFLKATPWLGTLVLAVVLFMGSCHLTDYVVLYEDIKADEIASVQILETDQVFDRYQSYLLGDDLNNSCKDQSVIELVAESLAASQAMAREDRYSYIYENRTVATQIKLKDGRVISRYVTYVDKDVQKSLAAYGESVSGKDITALPNADIIDSANIIKRANKPDSCTVEMGKKGYSQLMQSFVAEYQSLSPADRMLCRNATYNKRLPDKSGEMTHVLELKVYVETQTQPVHQVSYKVQFLITKDMFPNTFRLMSQYTGDYKPSTPETEIDPEEVTQS